MTRDEELRLRLAHLRLLRIATEFNPKFRRSREFVRHCVLASPILDSEEVDIDALSREAGEIAQRVINAPDRGSYIE